MKKNGIGVYYKPGISLNENSQFISDIGFHFGSSTQSVTYYSYSNHNRPVLMEISGGYERELFTVSIAGIFLPVFIFQGGSAFDLKKLSLNNIPDNYFLIYAVGMGVQFYNDKITNELLLILKSSTNESA